MDRPAHMVKELVENSLDAGATEIDIQVSEGGRQVQISDNGKGIPKDQLELAISRHATSKIFEANDLWNLSSFGFRGEALATIAAVSRLTLISQPKEQEQAYEICCEFGQFNSAQATGGNLGTTVIVKDLFENMPARLKFLKSERAELAQMKQALRALALLNSNVSFRIKNE